jgi:hypothetical protein
MALEKPAPTGDVFDVSSHVGALLVLEPLEDVPPMVTKASKDPQPAVRANIYVVTPPGQVSEEYHGALLFQKLLWQRLRQSIGKQVCGILTGSPGQVVNGRNVPYDLADPPDAAFEAASRAMMGRPQSQPATGQQGPWGGPSSGTAPAPWQQPAQQPQAPWGQPRRSRVPHRRRPARGAPHRRRTSSGGSSRSRPRSSPQGRLRAGGNSLPRRRRTSPCRHGSASSPRRHRPGGARSSSGPVNTAAAGCPCGTPAAAVFRSGSAPRCRMAPVRHQGAP